MDSIAAASLCFSDVLAAARGPAASSWRPEEAAAASAWARHFQGLPRDEACQAAGIAATDPAGELGERRVIGPAATVLGALVRNPWLGEETRLWAVAEALRDEHGGGCEAGTLSEEVRLRASVKTLTRVKSSPSSFSIMNTHSIAGPSIESLGPGTRLLTAAVAEKLRQGGEVGAVEVLENGRRAGRRSRTRLTHLALAAMVEPREDEEVVVKDLIERWLLESGAFEEACGGDDDGGVGGEDDDGGGGGGGFKMFRDRSPHRDRTLGQVSHQVSGQEQVLGQVSHQLEAQSQEQQQQLNMNRSREQTSTRQPLQIASQRLNQPSHRHANTTSSTSSNNNRRSPLSGGDVTTAPVPGQVHLEGITQSVEGSLTGGGHGTADPGAVGCLTETTGWGTTSTVHHQSARGARALLLSACSHRPRLRGFYIETLSGHVASLRQDAGALRGEGTRGGGWPGGRWRGGASGSSLGWDELRARFSEMLLRPGRCALREAAEKAIRARRPLAGDLPPLRGLDPWEDLATELRIDR